MSKYSVVYDLDFKRQDTTYIMSVQLYGEDNKIITPNTSHTWVAKIVKGTKTTGKNYSVSFDGNTINVPAKQFAELPTGDYGLELWEKNNGNVTIYPSAGFIPFRIHRNADDSLTEIDPTIDINQLIADLHQAGLNVVFDNIEILDAGAKAQVTSEVRDGKNYISLKIPRGPQGVPGPPPAMRVASVTKSAPGSNPQVTFTKTANGYDVSYVLPQGPQGENWKPADKQEILEELKKYIDDEILNTKY